jgi:hypothetical protein
MRTLLIVSMIALLAGAASAQDGNQFGIFFSDSDFTQENTNWDTDAAPFNGYLVLVGPTVSSVGGYECSIELSDATVFVLGVSGPNGWTNFGSNLNHLVGYQTPLPASLPGTVLATVNMLYTSMALVEIRIGPASPPSIPGVPVIADGTDPENLIACSCVTDDCLVATLNGDGVVATEDYSWSGVKALFD